jgi:hypothetical protein
MIAPDSRAAASRYETAPARGPSRKPRRAQRAAEDRGAVRKPGFCVDEIAKATIILPIRQ